MDQCRGWPISQIWGTASSASSRLQRSRAPRADPRRLRLRSRATSVSPDFPTGREYRKYWEVAMTLRAFRRSACCVTTPGCWASGPGTRRRSTGSPGTSARSSPPTSTGTEDVWSETDSGADMLTDPGRYWDGPWNPERLEVLDMERAQRSTSRTSPSTGSSPRARSSTSATSRTCRRSVEEMFRVLRPGGRGRSGDGVPSQGTRARLAGAAALRRARAPVAAPRRPLVGSGHATRHLDLGGDARRAGPDRRRRWPTSSRGSVAGAATRTSCSATTRISGPASTSPWSSRG